MSARHLKFVNDALNPRGKCICCICPDARDWLMALPAKMSFKQAYEKCKDLDFLQFIYEGEIDCSYRCSDPGCLDCEGWPTKATVIRRYKKAVPWAEFKKRLTGAL